MIFLNTSDSIKDSLQAYVQHVKSMGPGAWLMAELLARKGQPFHPKSLPPDIQRGVPKSCFMNATFLAMERGYDYIEGVIIRKDIPIGIHHAWCTSPGSDEVIDNTLVAMDSDRYFGIRFSIDRLKEILETAKFYGYLQDYSKPNYELALDLDPTLAEMWPDMKKYIQR